ncbi:RimK family alpha-L-glutamate ligase [Streptomyces sp. NPDC090303]|uniref:ATP-grasp domain-containing protein n=1 Tax=Streptomyces sp. NPDC090303 TaxID=3365960 RepID=UPI00382F7401
MPKEQPTVLLHLPHPAMLDATAARLGGLPGTGAGDPRRECAARPSREVLHLTRVFQERGWRCLWAPFSEVDPARLLHRGVYDVAAGTRRELTASGLNTEVDVIVARLLGSVESRITTVRAYFETLRERFTGTVVNDPASVLYGLRKDYLFEYLKRDFRTIPTEAFEPSVTFRELSRACGGRLDDHIVKPVTGELSNSFMAMSQVDDRVLRHKEPLVGGWLLQPFVPHVWDGEFQVFFVGDRIVHGMRKHYPGRDRSGVPTRAGRVVDPYTPTAVDTAFAREARALWTEDLAKPTDLCRVDFLKEPDGTPVLLEFEAVNPGFSFGRLDEPAGRRLAGFFEDHIRARMIHG